MLSRAGLLVATAAIVVLLIGGFLMSQLASLAAGYVVTKVTGVLGQHWWGRIVVTAAERRLRLSRGIDDAYAEWLLGRTAQSRQAELERQLRSPRSPGGHAPQSFSDPQP